MTAQGGIKAALNVMLRQAAQTLHCTRLCGNGRHEVAQHARSPSCLRRVNELSSERETPQS